MVSDARREAFCLMKRLAIIKKHTRGANRIFPYYGAARPANDLACEPKHAF
jgi:hypothetical protein